MKTLLLVMMFAGGAQAAVGDLVYESAASSIAVVTVALSSGTPALISAGPNTTVASGSLSISWYSLTLFNAESSTAAYAFSSSSFTAPGLTCANGAPIGSGTEAGPWNQTEQFFGCYMWGISCKSTGGFNIKVVRRGR